MSERGVAIATDEHDAPAPKKRSMRADAVLNRLRILEAAEEVFARQGVSAPIDAVAEHAGVGVGTVYRHFATKEALLEAIVFTRLAELVSMADAQADAADATEALFSFLREFAAKVSDKRDLIDALSVAGIDIKSQCAGMADKLEEGVGRMLVRAQEEGTVRRDVKTHEVMTLIIGSCQSADHSGASPDSRIRMVTIVCDGLREPTGFIRE